MKIDRTPTVRDIFYVSYPIFLSFLIVSVINVTNTAFLGRVGEVELGASALGGVFYMSMFMIGLGFSIGSQIIIGRRNGEHNYHKIGEIFHHGLVFLLLLAAVIVAIVHFKGADFLHGTMYSSEVSEATIRYLDIRIFGLFFIFSNSLFRAFYVGTTRTGVLIWNAAITAIVNVVFDYLLIFGVGGFPCLGIEGAAIASVLAEGVALLFMIIYTVNNVDNQRYVMRPSFHFRMNMIRGILSVSIYSMWQSFLSIATWFVFFIGIEHLGERPLAVSNVVRSLYMLLLLPVLSLGTTCNTLVSNLIGAGEADSVLRLIWRIIRLTLLIVLPFVIIVFLFPTFFIRIFTDDASLVADTVAPLLVLTSAILFAAVGNVLFNAVGGTGNTKIGLVIELICLVVYISYIWILIFVQKASVAMCWTTEHLYWILLFLFCMWYLRKGKWKNREI